MHSTSVSGVTSSEKLSSAVVYFYSVRGILIRVSIWGSDCVVVSSLSNSSHRAASFESAIVARRGARGGATTGEEGRAGGKKTRVTTHILAGFLHSSADDSVMLFSQRYYYCTPGSSHLSRLTTQFLLNECQATPATLRLRLPRPAVLTHAHHRRTADAET